jgi:DNA repair exonuclease SbcCD ATPase subunit
MLLKQIRPDLTLDKGETLRLGLAKKRTIQTLGNRYEALMQNIGKAEREIRKQEEEIKRDHEALSQLAVGPEPHALLQILKRVQKAGDLDEDLQQRHRTLESSKETSRKRLAQLGIWSGPLNEVSKLPVPMLETVNRFEEELESLNQKRDRIRTEEGELDAELRRLFTQLHEIEYGGGVPTEEELLKVRSSRDVGWGLLKRQWLDGEDVAEEAGGFSPDSPLTETYENLVGVSDQTADRLRREADRVQKHASLKSLIEGIEDRRMELNREIERLDANIGDAYKRWHELWSGCGIHPLSPREMRQWLSEFEKIRYQIGETEREADETAARERVRQELQDALFAEIRRVGDNLEFGGREIRPVLEYAETLLENMRSNQTKRETLEEKIHEKGTSMTAALHDRKSAEDEMKQWQDNWKEALTPLGLDSGTRPEEAVEYIETLQACFEKLKEADELQKRIGGIDRDSQEFRKEVENLVAQIAPDLIDQEIVQAVFGLQAGLNRAREEKAVLQQYLEETDTLEKNLLQNQTTINNNKRRMASLLQTARCEKEEELDEAEFRSNEYMSLKEKLSEIESQMAQIAGGVSFSELEGQAREVDPNSLLGEIERLSHEIEDRLDGEIRRLSEAIGQEKNQMARMDGSGRAAELADDSQNVLAKIRRLSEHFIRVKLASRILRDVIESYRLEHQDPVLKIASKYFKDITLDSFISLRTDVDDHGQGILIGVRSSGARVNVEGMSDGTRDQLYLALRLATLEWRLESSDPVPFIVDDILINFDDDRARATLKAMAELAGKNQIILFTHHQRIVETARKMDADQKVFIHEI